ncbi:MAG: alkaline phosphatase D family protein [Caldilineales bacterium]|nr:alkaline phosphatase D family protein [Caldilineales bacterium]
MPIDESKRDRLRILAGLALAITFLLGFSAATTARESTPGDQAGKLYLPLIASPTPPLVFAQGVASGDVTSTSAVLWTRCDRAATVTLEIALNAGFAPLVKIGTAELNAENDFIARLDVSGLKPDIRYFYRWRSEGSVSPTGQFVTAPKPQQSADLRLAFTGDSDGTMIGGKPYYGSFKALDAARRDEPDFFVYLGDTIYSDSTLRTTGPAITLADYRDAYKVNRQIDALPDLLAVTSTYAIWDDHEVYNDFAGQTVNPARFANGRRAFLDYMPVRTSDLPEDPTCAGRPLFRVFHWGSEADIFILDERSCRSEQVTAACTAPGGLGADAAPALPAATRLLLGLPANPPAGCRAALNDPARTMLGPVQKSLLKQGLRESTARFKFVISELAIQQIFIFPYDRWEGYAAERRELLEFIRDEGIDNVVFLSADLHANFYNEVSIDFFSAPQALAFEVVTGPIGTGTMEEGARRFGGQSWVDQLHLLYDVLGVDCRSLDAFGYGLVDVAGGRATITLRDEDGQVMHDQRNPNLTCSKTLP